MMDLKTRIIKTFFLLLACATMLFSDASQPFQLNFLTLQPRSCVDSSNGSLAIGGSGGTIPYSFTLNGSAPNNGSSPVAAAFILTTPTTSALVRGIDSSTPNQSLVVKINSVVSFFQTVILTLEFSCNGVSVFSSASDREARPAQSINLTGPHFNETNSSGFGFGVFPTNPQDGLQPGHYTITFTPQNTGNRECNKPLIIEFDITQLPLSIRAVNNIVCSFKENTGSLSVFAQGGVPPFTYSISGPTVAPVQITPNRQATFDNLANGDYTVTVEDSNIPTPCTQTSVVRVNSKKCKSKIVSCAKAC